jgi:dTDP-4-amino-4,6-dideoxygalactose transaminase
VDELITTKLAIDGGTPIRDSFLPFGVPCLGEEESQEILDTLQSGWIGTGPKTMKFERMLAEYVGARHAVTVNSCTAGLFLSLLVSGVGPGDEVITTALTFGATANVIVHCGARPVFVDIDPVTLNIDPAQIEAAITPRTKAIMPVHFGGLACAMDEITALARTHALAIVEDAAHAIGAKYKGQMIGSMGHLTSFSFYPNKNMTTGEGGAIMTNDDALAEQLQVYRLHGLSRHAWQRYAARRLMLSDVILPGYKYNLTDLQSSLGIHQLQKLERFLAIREQYAQIYDDAFTGRDDIALQPRPQQEANRHALHLYVLILKPDCFQVPRNQIVDALLAENVGAAIHYRALHMHPYYAETFGYDAQDYPHAAHVGENILTLPLSPKMTPKDVDDVIAAVERVLGAYRR